MKRIFTIFFAMAVSLLYSQPSFAQIQDDEVLPEMKTLNKSNLVRKEWLTDMVTNTKLLDHSTTYNSEGKKVEEIEYNDRGLQWRKIYEYGANGKISRELTYDFRNRLDNIKKYEYNEYNRRKLEYTYNPKGKLVKIKTYEYIVAK